MAELSSKDTLPKALSKKETEQAVLKKLTSALAEYQDQFGKKKFQSKLKKAAGLFAIDIAKSKKKAGKVKPAKVARQK